MQWLVRIGWWDGTIEEFLVTNPDEFQKTMYRILVSGDTINYVKWLNEA